MPKLNDAWNDYIAAPVVWPWNVCLLICIVLQHTHKALLKVSVQFAPCKAGTYDNQSALPEKANAEQQSQG